MLVSTKYNGLIQNLLKKNKKQKNVDKKGELTSIFLFSRRNPSVSKMIAVAFYLIRKLFAT